MENLTMIAELCETIEKMQSISTSFVASSESLSGNIAQSQAFSMQFGELNQQVIRSFKKFKLSKDSLESILQERNEGRSQEYYGRELLLMIT